MQLVWSTFQQLPGEEATPSRLQVYSINITGTFKPLRPYYYHTRRQACNNTCLLPRNEAYKLTWLINQKATAVRPVKDFNVHTREI